MTKILIVEDEDSVLDPLELLLSKEGFSIETARNGREGLDKFWKVSPDLVLLDIMLPEVSGTEVCRQIRAKSNVPIIMLTAKDTEVDKVVGLELGADDYVTKPYSVREVVARVKAILRRVSGAEEKKTFVRAGELEVDLERYVTTVKGASISLSSKEFEFLKCLIGAKGRVLTREQLLEQVWGYDNSFEIDTRTVDQHIARLREKLGPESGRVITVKNVGYRLKLD